MKENTTKTKKFGTTNFHIIAIYVASAALQFGNKRK